MPLSSEDTLRLNVLLANKPQAIRINESSMTLYGLLEDGEVTVKLNPEGFDDKYLKQVRSFLSERALGSPGGYPLYLQRWTRMGQMREESLEQLLMLGDPTAVFAVVCAEGLTPELARRAWWAAEEAENARRMLQTPAVAASETGREMARYLIEFLPFETEPEAMMESVAAALQPGLLEEQAREALWKKAARKTPYLVGFIAAIPDDLPERRPERADLETLRPLLMALSEAGNPVAALCLRLLSGPGQAYVGTVLRILAKPPTQEVVNTTLDQLRAYAAAVRPEGNPDLPLEQLQEEAENFLQDSNDARALLERAPGLAPEVKSMRILSGLGYGVLRPVLRSSDAIGSLMRRKLEPVMTPLRQELEIFLGTEKPRRLG
ncbi:MAG TPA: sulfur reduction protein DsrS [Sedimenticola sp.]|nr:sulfur reduction protein DsrS [Sedimenticola sp.]